MQRSPSGKEISLTRVGGLDVLRGLAVGLVLVRHAWPEVFGGAGIVGVVIFFALSGYLITGLLLGDLMKLDRIRLRRFYLHRAVRLYPPLLALLVGFVIVSFSMDPSGDRSRIVPSLVVAALYVGDIPRLGLSSSLSHLWTLAVEEQFYLIWPMVVAFGWRTKQLRMVLLGSTLLLYGSCIATVLIWNSNVELIYSLPTSWAITLVIGSAARVYDSEIRKVLTPTRLRYATPAALVFLLIVCFIPDAKDQPIAYLVIGPAVASGCVAVMCSVRTWRSVPPALMPLQALGRISYAVYLWDLALTVWFGYDRWYLPLAAGLCSVVAATVSWFAIEKPLQRARRRLDDRLVVV